MTMDHKKTQLVNNAIIFIHSLTEVYGTEQGIELWDSINRSIPSDIRDSIFLTMISTADGQIKCKGLSLPLQEINRVEVIKCIRTYTGKNLKETIEILRDLEQDRIFSFYVEPKLVGTIKKQLTDWGIKL